MELKRILNLEGLLRKKSFFLLGPRSTGKSTLIGQQLGRKALIIDLLDSDYYLRLQSRPKDLEFMIENRKLVVLDEIQKIPQLLDEVHRLIEKKKITFLLTGSSARKLKRNHSNMLAGRAWVANLFPLVTDEIPSFNLDRYLQYGGLPQVYSSKYPVEELKAYVKTYLYEEIQSEALARNIPSFSRFLEVAALFNGELINFTNIGSDSQLSPSTVREYYRLLEDTLMGFMLQPWTKSKKRKAIQTAKFYFFDTGVVSTLARTETLDRNSDLYGKAFEHFIGMELKAYLSYRRLSDELTFWRSINGQEVDFIIGNHTAIEVKSTKKVDEKHLKGLRALREENYFKKYYLISHDAIPQTIHGIICRPWKTFLEELWKK